MTDRPSRRWAWPLAWVASGAVVLGTVGLRFDPDQTSDDLPLVGLAHKGMAREVLMILLNCKPRPSVRSDGCSVPHHEQTVCHMEGAVSSTWWRDARRREGTEPC